MAQTAGPAVTCMRLASWADASCRQERARSSAWSVTDEAARDFVAEFYRRFTAGLPLGGGRRGRRSAPASQHAADTRV